MTRLICTVLAVDLLLACVPALAAVMILLSRFIGKRGMLFPFLCVLFCCAGACVGVLCRASLMTVGTGTTAVLLTALLVPERSGRT